MAPNRKNGGTLLTRSAGARRRTKRTNKGPPAKGGRKGAGRPQSKGHCTMPWILPVSVPDGKFGANVYTDVTRTSFGAPAAGITAGLMTIMPQYLRNTPWNHVLTSNTNAVWAPTTTATEKSSVGNIAAVAASYRVLGFTIDIACNDVFTSAKGELTISWNPEKYLPALAPEAAVSLATPSVAWSLTDPDASRQANFPIASLTAPVRIYSIISAPEEYMEFHDFDVSGWDRDREQSFGVYNIAYTGGVAATDPQIVVTVTTYFEGVAQNPYIPSAKFSRFDPPAIARAIEANHQHVWYTQGRGGVKIMSGAA